MISSFSLLPLPSPASWKKSPPVSSLHVLVGRVAGGGGVGGGQGGSGVEGLF